MSSVKVKIEIQMPGEELEPLMRALRAWEGGRTSIQLGMHVEGIEQLEAAEDITRRLIMMVGNLNPPLPFVSHHPRVMHLLHNGMTVCGLGPTKEKPDACQWMPVGHLWVPIEALEKVTCHRCLLQIERLEELIAAAILKVTNA